MGPEYADSNIQTIDKTYINRTIYLQFEV
jgi:hypothetical protein